MESEDPNETPQDPKDTNESAGKKTPTGNENEFVRIMSHCQNRKKMKKKIVFLKKTKEKTRKANTSQ